MFGWISKPVQNRVPNPTKICGQGLVGLGLQMLVYKHEMHVGGPFWDIYMKKLLFEVATVEAKNDKK